MPIRWPDQDAFGHVNNAVYLTYLEAARDAWLARAIGSREAIMAYLLRRVEIDYTSPLQQRDGEAVVEVELLRVGTSSVTTRERVTAASDGREVASAVAVLVHVDASRVRSAPIPAELRARLERAGGP